MTASSALELPASMVAWCAAALGSPPTRVIFASGHLSHVCGVRLRDERTVVLKARPADERIRACSAVHRYLAGTGFPCPRPLAGPDQVGSQMFTAEAYVAGARPVPPAPGIAARSAGLLARLVRLARPLRTDDRLSPAPAWMAWDHREPGGWPLPDDMACDLNQVPGPPPVDEAGRLLRARLRAAVLEAVVGHLDWESHNLVWRGGGPVAVLDWDSIGLRPEAAVAGAAAAVFPSLGGTVAATVAQTGSFLRSYQDACGRVFTLEEEQVAWAAGAWVLAFNAKKESVGGPGGPYQRHFARYGEQRLLLAGA